MHSLRDQQRRIVDAVLGDSADSAAPAHPAGSTLSLIDAPADLAAAQLAVYRNTVQSNLITALRSTYPAVLRLVGAEYFRAAAHDFLTRYPSRSGDLRHLSAPFPAYLAERHAHDAYRYLGEVARWELMIEDVLLAAEHSPLDLSRLAAVPPAAVDALRFTLHPTLRLFESAYPVRRIWESNVGSDAEPESLDLSVGGDRLAVLRQRLQLHFHPVSRGEWCWLSACSSGEPFAASIEAAAASDPTFDATLALQRLVAAGAIVGFA